MAGQIGTGCSVTHDYTNMPVAPEYNNRIRSATHTFQGTLPEQKDSIRFIANYFNPLGAAPSNATVWFDGQVLQLTCDAYVSRCSWMAPHFHPPLFSAFGVPSNCAYRSPVVPVVAADTTSSNCRLYFFEFFDGPAPGVRQRYPEVKGIVLLFIFPVSLMRCPDRMALSTRLARAVVGVIGFLRPRPMLL